MLIISYILLKCYRFGKIITPIHLMAKTASVLGVFIKKDNRKFFRKNTQKKYQNFRLVLSFRCLPILFQNQAPVFHLFDFLAACYCQFVERSDGFLHTGKGFLPVVGDVIQCLERLCKGILQGLRRDGCFACLLLNGNSLCTKHL